MEIKILKSQINHLLNEINLKYQKINSNDNKIPQIEIDIILSNIRDIYELIDKLNLLNKIDIPIIIESKPIEKHQVVQEKVESTKTDDKIKEIKEKVDFIEVVDNEATTNRVINDELNFQDELEFAIDDDLIDETKKQLNVNLRSNEEKPLNKKNQPKNNEEIKPKEKQPELTTKTDLQTDQKKTTLKEPVKPQQKNIVTVAEKLTTEKKSINEIIALNASDNTLASKLQKKPITNLKTAIGINEKFLFTKELFSGNNDLFNNAINKLNSFSNFQEAQEYFVLLKKTQNWDENNEYIAKFHELVERRYV